MKVYNDLGKGVLTNAWEGFNTSLFAYGQTGSGKSWSIVGYGTNKGNISPFSLSFALFFFYYYYFGVIDLTFTASHFYSPSFDFYCFPSSLHSICPIYRSFKGRILNNGCLSSLVVTSL